MSGDGAGSSGCGLDADDSSPSTVTENAPQCERCGSVRVADRSDWVMADRLPKTSYLRQGTPRTDSAPAKSHASVARRNSPLALRTPRQPGR